MARMYNFVLDKYGFLLGKLLLLRVVCELVESICRPVVDIFVRTNVELILCLHGASRHVFVLLKMVWTVCHYLIVAH